MLAATVCRRLLRRHRCICNSLTFLRNSTFLGVRLVKVNAEPSRGGSKVFRLQDTQSGFKSLVVDDVHDSEEPSSSSFKVSVSTDDVTAQDENDELTETEPSFKPDFDDVHSASGSVLVKKSCGSSELVNTGNEIPKVASPTDDVVVGKGLRAVRDCFSGNSCLAGNGRFTVS